MWATWAIPFFVDANDLQMLEQSTHDIALYESFNNSVFLFYQQCGSSVIDLMIQ